VLTGAELFTSSTLTLTAKASGRITWGQLLRNWLVVFVANFLGALTIVPLVYVAGTWHNAEGQWGRVVLSVSTARLHHNFIEVFTLEMWFPPNRGGLGYAASRSGAAVFS
jgi:formate transporter